MSKTKGFLLAAGIVLAMSFTFSCSSDGDNGDSSGSVTYEGQIYRTVKIGKQVWFAENLNYNVSGSMCYDNSESNCNTYGRLYNWATAMGLPLSCNSSDCLRQIKSPHKGICPDGWHIPSEADWDKLYRFVDGTSGTSSRYTSPTAGKYLKAKSGWSEDGNGTDKFGFSALPGGYGYSDGSFSYVGYYGGWWSAKETKLEVTNGIYRFGHDRYIDYEYDIAFEQGSYKDHLFSVRCLQD
ncbi:MAG: fibrobacter succinogenes major paralogous domain-containing protein [Candidatus Fibromonas sp.]|nr:fibrobacter succinogenes major paralogous domain-containing protein [Candidatus Fibromonas sp.]